MALAQKCVPVNSSWVSQFVWMCDDRLAVQFRNGVCCYYPSTSRGDFQLALAWGSPGQFVHRMLYKKRAYRLIRPPCPPSDDCISGGVVTGCCPQTIPTTLYATITGAGAVNGTYTMTYNAADGRWIASFPFSPCIELDIVCQSPTHTWFSLIGGYATSTFCSPLVITWASIDFTGCGGGASGTMTVTT